MGSLIDALENRGFGGSYVGDPRNLPFHVRSRAGDEQARLLNEGRITPSQAMQQRRQGPMSGSQLGLNPTAGTQMPSPYEDPAAVARQKYGFLAGFVNHPEIGPILRQAAMEGWGEHELYGAIYATDFWKNTSAAQRTWWQLTNEDPAEARRLVGQTAATIQNRAKSLGLNMSSGAIANLARTATENGWTDAQTVDMIMQQVNWATIENGDLTALRDQVRATAGDYLVGISEQTARQYAQRIASGEMSMQGVQSAMLAQAKQRFGWMADQLDQGVTVKQYLQPLRDTIAAELEMSPEAIDLTDSRWLKMIETRGEDGKMRAATLNEAQLAARREPEWVNTRGAQETSTRMINTIADMFGRRAV